MCRRARWNSFSLHILLTQSYTGQDGLAVSNVTATEYSRAYISWSGRAPCRPTGVTISKRCGRGPGANCLDRFLIISMAGQRRSEEHTSELQSLMRISYAVFCLKKTNKQYHITHS